MPRCIGHYWNQNSGFTLSSASGSLALLVELWRCGPLKFQEWPLCCPPTLLVVRSPWAHHGAPILGKLGVKRCTSEAAPLSCRARAELPHPALCSHLPGSTQWLSVTLGYTELLRVNPGKEKGLQLFQTSANLLTETHHHPADRPQGLSSTGLQLEDLRSANISPSAPRHKRMAFYLST